LIEVRQTISYVEALLKSNRTVKTAPASLHLKKVMANQNFQEKKVAEKVFSSVTPEIQFASK